MASSIMLELPQPLFFNCFLWLHIPTLHNYSSGWKDILYARNSLAFKSAEPVENQKRKRHAFT